MPSIRIYPKKQIRLDGLNFRQTRMFKIGNVGVAAVKNRVTAAQGPTDSSAKPLTKRYAIWKTKLGRGNRRNLSSEIEPWIVFSPRNRNLRTRRYKSNPDREQIAPSGGEGPWR